MCSMEKGEKTKTKFVAEILKSEFYERKPYGRILEKDSLRAKAQIMGMCGMLECAQNFRHMFGGHDCKLCKVVDNEDHRINYCPNFSNRNLYYSRFSFDFKGIYSDDEDTVNRSIDVILCLWNLENGQNTMK